MLRTPPTDPARRVGTVHAAGIEFDYAFFVGQAAESDAVLVGIVFRAFHHFQGGVERVAAILEECEGIVEIFIAIVRR